jgi:hypothetical protein
MGHLSVKDNVNAGGILSAGSALGIAVQVLMSRPADLPSILGAARRVLFSEKQDLIVRPIARHTDLQVKHPTADHISGHGVLLFAIRKAPKRASNRLFSAGLGWLLRPLLCPDHGLTLTEPPNDDCKTNNRYDTKDNHLGLPRRPSLFCVSSERSTSPFTSPHISDP